MTLGGYLKKLRTDKCITQRELSKMLDVSVQSICYFESNTSKPGLKTLRKYSEIFNVDTELLSKMKYEE